MINLSNNVIRFQHAVILNTVKTVKNSSEGYYLNKIPMMMKTEGCGYFMVVNVF